MHQAPQTSPGLKRRAPDTTDMHQAQPTSHKHTIQVPGTSDKHQVQKTCTKPYRQALDTTTGIMHFRQA